MKLRRLKGCRYEVLGRRLHIKRMLLSVMIKILYNKNVAGRTILIKVKAGSVMWQRQ